VEPPALIKGYLRLGAKVLGAPAWDPDFNTADLPMLMRIADLPARYRKHFLGADEGASPAPMLGAAGFAGCDVRRANGDRRRRRRPRRR
jgi:hypothetical protein